MTLISRLTVVQDRLRGTIPYVFGVPQYGLMSIRYFDGTTLDDIAIKVENANVSKMSKIRPAGTNAASLTIGDNDLIGEISRAIAAESFQNIRYVSISNYPNNLYRIAFRDDTKATLWKLLLKPLAELPNDGVNNPYD